MKIGNVEIKSKFILAPLAGYTDGVYRLIAKSCGAGLVYTEMISCKGILYDSLKTKEYTVIDDAERPVALQLFGSDISDMVAAVKKINHLNYDILDINMGCPVKKVVNAKAGSYLLRDLSYLEKMVKEVVKVSAKPVSVKIRLGYDTKNHVEIARAAERGGAALLAVHGRTKAQGFKGSVDYEAIREVKKAVKIPVAGNGDVRSVSDLEKMLSTGVDFVMIGRASIGNPWIFAEFAAYLEKKEFIPPSIATRLNLLKQHFLAKAKAKGDRCAVLEIRSLAAYYVKGLAGAKEFRISLAGIKDRETFLNILDQLTKKVTCNAYCGNEDQR